MTSEKSFSGFPRNAIVLSLAGSLFMHTNGDLYISAGDNTNPFNSDGFAPLDEQPGVSAWDSQKSASNENDLEGKNSAHSSATRRNLHDSERQSFSAGDTANATRDLRHGLSQSIRMAVDEGTGWLYWGEVGPDASADAPSRGPKGHRRMEPGSRRRELWVALFCR